MKAQMCRLSVSVDSPFGPDDQGEDDSSILAMTTFSTQSSTSTLKDTSRIERMRKLLSSPLSSKRKSGGSQMTFSNGLNFASSSSASPPHSNSKANGYQNVKSKIFGAPLSSHSGIPFVVTRLCSYIEAESGLQQEGLFRISGNVRLIEKLKNLFDSCGDAPLEEIADVASAAALVKLFFRELPEPVIPANMHQILFQAARDYSNSDYYLQQQQKSTQQVNSCDGKQSSGTIEASSEVTVNPNGDTNEVDDDEAIKAKERHSTYVQRIRTLISILPSTNFYTLRYLCCFLNRVSQCQSSNKMNAVSLGIVFGPTVFRISTQEYTTLRDEAIDGPNQVVTALITECHVIFNSVPDPSFSNSTVVLLDQCRNVILSGRSCSKRGTTKTKKGASIDLCDLRHFSLHQMRRNVSQDEDDSKVSPFFAKKNSSKKKNSNTIVPIVVLSRTEDESDLNCGINVNSMNNLMSDKLTQQINRRKALLSSTSGNLIRSVSEERASCYLKNSFDSITNELRRCASSDSLIKSKHESTALAAVVAATTASLLFPSCASLVPVGVQGTSASASSSSSSPNSLSPCISPSVSEQSNSNTKTSIETVIHDEVSSEAVNEEDSNIGDASDEDALKDDCQSIDCKSYVTDDKCASEYNIKSDLSNDSLNTESSDPSSCVTVSSFLVSVDSNDDTELKDTFTSVTNCEDELMVQLTEESNDVVNENLNVTRTINFHNESNAQCNNSLCDVTTKSVVVSTTSVDEVTFSKEDESSSTASSSASSSAFFRQSSSTSSIEREAPVSPSAFRPNLTRRVSEHLLNVAPSPPLEQDNYSGHSQINTLKSAAVNSVRREINCLKKEIKKFEVDFKLKHGYPPSMDQKMNSTLARPVLFELNKLKKTLKDFKQEAMNEGDTFIDKRYLKELNLNEFLLSLSTLKCEEQHLDRDKSVTKKCTCKKFNSFNEDFLSVPRKTGRGGGGFKKSSSCSESSSDANTWPNLEGQLHKLKQVMTIKRIICDRPEDINCMTAGQIMDEKTDLQRELLKFESIYGHPECEGHRQIMRPIYDRYRSVKRLVAKMPGVNEITVELSNSFSVDENTRQCNSSSGKMSPNEKSILPNSSCCKVHTCVTCLDEDANESLEAITENVAVEFKQIPITRSNPSSSCNSCSSSCSSKSNSGCMNGGGEVNTTSEGPNIVAISPSHLARMKKQPRGGGVAITCKPINVKPEEKVSFCLIDENESVDSNSEIIQYHEMSLMQLMEQLNRSRSEKKQLKRIIHLLEEDMSKKLGRKIEKEDRIQPVYTSHRQVKSKLRLLKALVAKYDKDQHPLPVDS